MRLNCLAVIAAASLLLLGFAMLQAKPAPNQRLEPKDDPTPAFKPVEVNSELDANDPKDPKIDQPAKKFTVKLTKGKTYIIDLASKDFDSYLRLLDKTGQQLAEDDDGGGGENAQIIYTPTETADHQIVAITLDGDLGKFTLEVRELVLQGEAKPRDVGNGIKIVGQIGKGDVSPVGKLGKVFSVQLKKGQTYTFDLSSPTIDSYLFLFDAKNKLLAQDDDSGGDMNARIVFRAERDGVYHLIATSDEGDETGAFTLNVRKTK